MTYSKIHQAVSKKLNTPEVLIDPEKFLGENFQIVLEFWKFIDTLLPKDFERISSRYNELHEREGDLARKLDFCLEGINTPVRIACFDSAYNNYMYSTSTYRAVAFSIVYATHELINYYNSDNSDKQLYFLPLFEEFLVEINKNSLSKTP
jgi:hypothetical protein